MRIENNKVVTIEYKLMLEDGTVVDSSAGKAPHVYLQGAGNIVPGLEVALEGHSEGAELDVKVLPTSAYGRRNDELVHKVPRSKFPPGEIKIGMKFEAEGKRGPALLRVVGLDDNDVTVDSNHPLAGKTLVFSVKVLNVRDATPAELADRRAHTAGYVHPNFRSDVKPS
ncbi:MAG: peptidylprolyl isomerase [Deltaproteobacteria bacterium]|nr:peptidylprolyl isomerase [Deltaproteobacteria bacterium]